MFYVGIDLGGTNIAVGIVTEEGKIVKKTSVPTRAERPFTEIVKDMAACIAQLLKETGIKESEIRSIGIGSPGSLDTEKGILIYAGNFADGKNIDLRGEMRKYYDLPVYIGNDANVAALGETVSGAAKGVKNAIMITLGTGVGGGIIIDGKIYEGEHSAAGELGHIVLVHGGEQCSCGRKGCWEAYASVTALVRQTKAAMKANPDSVMNQTPLDRVNGRTAFDAAKKGDAAGKAVVEKYIEYVAAGLSDMVNIFRPEVLIVGGGISKEGEYLLAPVRELVRRDTYGGSMLPEQKLVAATLGNDAGLIGAALLHA